jgi:hypothetical protein
MTIHLGKLQFFAIGLLGLPVLVAILAGSGAALGYFAACVIR